MTEYTETADELRRIEAMVEREFQKIEKPVAPDKAPTNPRGE